MRELEGNASQHLTDAVCRLEGLDIGRCLVLLILIPVQLPKERELAGQVTDGFQVAVGQPEDAVGLHERHGGEDVIGDIAGAVDDHIGGDLTQAADELLCLLLGAGRIGVLVFPLAQPQHGQVGQLLVGGQVVLDEINSYRDNPGELIFDDFEELIYRGYSIGHNILGSEEEVRRVTREQICRFVKRYYTPERMVVSSIGDIPFESLVRLVERYFGDVPMGVEPLLRMQPDIYVPETRVEKRDTYQCHCVIGNVAYDYMQDNRLPLSLLVNLLGGTGMNSRLNLNIRERYGLAYNIEAAYTPYSDTGVFKVYFGCDPEDFDRCLNLCRREMHYLCDKPLGEKQLQKAKRQMIGQLVLSSENYENMMLSIGKSFLVYGKVDEQNAICEEVQGITSALLLQVAEEIFAEDKQSMLVYE